MKNSNQQMPNNRKIGIEIEYSGIDINKTSKILQQLFKGELSIVNGTIHKLENSELGDFTIELDAIPLQKIAAKQKEAEKSHEDDRKLIENIKIETSKIINYAGSKVVPLEIVSPPIDFDDISKLEKLIIELRKQGAKGTNENLHYAFGMHLNPEVKSKENEYIIRVLQSFLLIEPWLKKEHKIDISRKLTNFIDPFPKKYLSLILDKKYQANIDELIKDYHKYNPTRNRSLDMLPLFGHLNEDLVKSLYGEEEKINSRPTFHYRLPNCDLSNPDWSIKKELEIWLNVEYLSENNDLLFEMIEKWQEFQSKITKTESGWIKIVDKLLKNVK